VQIAKYANTSDNYNTAIKTISFVDDQDE
jgi:hypothetical protein